MNKKNITIITLIIILIVVLMGGFIFWLNNESNKEPVESFQHYPYEDITLVLSKDWIISDTKPQALMFQRDIETLEIPSSIDDLTIFVYKALPIHDLNTMVNSYSIYLKTTKHEIISLQSIDNDLKLNPAKWIKYNKNNKISETFFIQKNNIIYSITSSYPADNYNKNEDMNYDLYQIVKMIY